MTQYSLLRIQYRFKQEQAHRSKHQIIRRKQHDPETRALAVEYGGGGLPHGENRRNRDREQQQRQHDLAARRPQPNGPEEGSVHYQRPPPRDPNQQQLPPPPPPPHPVQRNKQRRQETFHRAHET